MPEPTCEGFGTHHKPVVMRLAGIEDDGGQIWECPKCLYVWRERPDIVAMTGKQTGP